MSLKTLANKASGAFARQSLTVRTHSPVLLLGLGVVGMTCTVISACRATLQLEKVLDEGKVLLDKVDEVAEPTEEEKEAKQKAKLATKVQVAIKVARLYAPTVIFGGATLLAITGSYVILNRRNTAVTAALGVTTKMFQDYRERVIADQGKEKDFEYRWGISEKEVITEDEHGEKIEVLKGLDQEAIIANQGSMYARVFGPNHEDWEEIPHRNQQRIASVQSHANTLLRVNGYVFLNDVYDMLGFERTEAGQVVGWVVNPEEGEGDGYIDFGVWNNGVYEGKEWINGHRDAILLDFNPDGNILGKLPKV